MFIQCHLLFMTFYKWLPSRKLKESSAVHDISTHTHTHTHTNTHTHTHTHTHTYIQRKCRLLYLQFLIPPQMSSNRITMVFANIDSFFRTFLTLSQTGPWIFKMNVSFNGTVPKQEPSLE